MQRVLETEVMDTLEEATDYDTMDHSAVNQLFAEDLIAIGKPLGDVLDLGTGTAQIPVAICERVADCRIMATDLAVNMLDLAVYNVELASLRTRIQLAQADANELPYTDQMFDTVISNSIIHHLPEPLLCLRGAVRVCKAGGLLFFRDLLRPESDEQVTQLVETYAGDANEHQRQIFDDSLRAALSLDEIRQLIETLGFDPATVQATSDRHWTWTAEKPAT